MRGNRWAFAGPAAAVIYSATVILGGLVTPGYSHVRDHVSALLQSGSTNGWLLTPPFLLYNALTLGVGLAVIAIVRAAGRPRDLAGIVAGAALIAEGVAGALTLAFPQDPVGNPATSTGATHIALAGLSSVLSMVAIGSSGLWLRNQDRHLLARYTFASLLVAFVGGGVAVIATANLDPLMGLYERAAIFGFVQWLFVFGLAVARVDVEGLRELRPLGWSTAWNERKGGAR